MFKEDKIFMKIIIIMMKSQLFSVYVDIALPLTLIRYLVSFNYVS